MESLGIMISSILTIVGAVIIGIPMIAFGQALGVFREIALNTRREEGIYTTQYKTLEVLGILTSGIGWIILVVGIVMGIYIIIAPLL